MKDSTAKKRGIELVEYTEAEELDLTNTKPFTILFIKPYNNSKLQTYSPPVGIITLAAILRKLFRSTVHVEFLDMKLYSMPPENITDHLKKIQPDVVAVSALNCEAESAYQIAAHTKRYNANIFTVIGGPFTLRQSATIFENSRFDWVFEGAADKSLPDALFRAFSKIALGDDIPGFSHRDRSGYITYNHTQSVITDLDHIPLPAWDLIDFDRYARRDRPRMITNIKGQRYATVFTSRGCPYLCNYCHDVFTKKFVYRSVGNVIDEIRLLHEVYNVKEIHFIDDIFNLHKPRVKEIMYAIKENWGKSILLAFPNGLRGDILDEDVISAMVDAGTYHVGISVETVTPRLQELIEKKLNIEKAKNAIDIFSKKGVIVQGAFMLGFPTETSEEIEATIKFAITSKLMQAHFFSVIPQRNTPIYELALSVSPEATLITAEREQRGSDYMMSHPWYNDAYGYDLGSRVAKAYFEFYLQPKRIAFIASRFRISSIISGTNFVFLNLISSILKKILIKFRSIYGIK